jgi:hypothetical protein
VRARIDGEAGDATENERVTVRRRFCRRLHADDLARAGTVLDNDLLAEKPSQARAHRARQEIAQSAGRIRRNDPQWLRRVRLGVRETRNDGENAEQRGDGQVHVESAAE